MAESRVPRVFHAGSSEPPQDVVLQDREGDRLLCDKGLWLYVEVHGTTITDESGGTSWADLDADYEVAWPLTEVLPAPAEAHHLDPCECCRTNDDPGFKHGGQCGRCGHTPKSHDSFRAGLAEAAAAVAPVDASRTDVEPDIGGLAQVDVSEWPGGVAHVWLEVDSYAHVNESATVVLHPNEAREVAAALTFAAHDVENRRAGNPDPQTLASLTDRTEAVTAAAPVDAGEANTVSAGVETGKGCCVSCGGSGGTLEGPCWDCRATGHAHDGPCLPKRINVAVNPETIAVISDVIDREGVCLTEAVRRLVGYGEVVYRAVREDGAEVLLKTGEQTREVVIL